MVFVSYVSKQSKTLYRTTLSYSVTLPSLQKFVKLYIVLSTWHFLLGTFYSYKTARTCIEPRSVERRLSFAVEVTGNWKHPLPLKIIFSTRFQWLLCFRNGRQLTPPTLHNPRTALLKCVSRIYICIYVSCFPLNYE